MTEDKRFTIQYFDDDCLRFIPFKRDEICSFHVDGHEFECSVEFFDIVDTEKLDYVGFIVPYSDLKECERDCNMMNVLDYLLKEKE